MRLKTLLLSVFLVLITLGTPARSPVEIRRLVSSIGELDFKKDVEIKYLDRRSLESYLEEIYANDYSPESAATDALFLNLMGFTRDITDLHRLRRQLILENAGGFYNEKNAELVVLKEFRDIPSFHGPILAHELRHALQDQHFSLRRLLGDYSDFDDRRLAVLAALEGDATLLMLRFMGLDPGSFSSSLSPQSLLGLTSAGFSPSLHTAPAILRHQLVMPYGIGLRFVSAIARKGKWSAINRMLAAPPDNTAQLIDPAKYLKKWRPAPVTVEYIPSGLVELNRGVVGEYNLNVLLDPENPQMEAARGWNGDRYALFSDGAGHLLCWKSSWQNRKAAERFLASFRAFLEKNLELDFRPAAVPGLLRAENAGELFLLADRAENLVYIRTNRLDLEDEITSGGIYD